MQEVKEAFLSKDVLTVVAALVLEPLADINRLREEDARVVQLILALLRNLLCIPDRSVTAGMPLLLVSHVHVMAPFQLHPMSVTASVLHT